MPDPRPPTILGPHGEGYCKVCHFIVGLDRNGLLINHKRGIDSIAGGICKGSLKVPPKLTPITSKLAAFKTSAPVRRCPYCVEDVSLTSLKTFSRHWSQPSVMCQGSGRFPPVPGRDHSGERGN
jgi:hypothetical protein